MSNDLEKDVAPSTSSINNMKAASNDNLHPDNFYYNNKPDFALLASKYENLKKFCFTTSNGKASIQWRHRDAVRTLTQVLLKHDWELSVDIPEWCLVPRLPNRLNYLLTIRDVLQHASILTDNEHIFGIDIGTGSTCIYPLLGAKALKWEFIGAEMDLESVEYAIKNVEKNNLQEKIEIIKIDGNKSILTQIMNKRNNRTFHFTMCNPPFYDTTELTLAVEMNENSERPNKLTRFELPNIVHRASRTPPSSKSLAKSSEVCVSGGEVEFVTALIDDSVTFADRIPVFSSMLGRKASLKPLIDHLMEKIATKRFTVLLLCQGRTSRWVLFWTFQDRINLPRATEARVKRVELKTSIDAQQQFEALQKDLKDRQFFIILLSDTKFEASASRVTWTKNSRKRKHADEQENGNNASCIILFEAELKLASSPESTFIELYFIYSKDVINENQIFMYIKSFLYVQNIKKPSDLIHANE